MYLAQQLQQLKFCIEFKVTAVTKVELLAMSEFQMKFEITISYNRQKDNQHR